MQEYKAIYLLCVALLALNAVNKVTSQLATTGQSVCYSNAENNDCGSTAVFIRVATPSECCIPTGLETPGTNFFDNTDCNSCPVCYTSDRACTGDVTTATFGTMEDCCDTGAQSYSGTDKTCSVCPACYTASGSCSGATSAMPDDMGQCCGVLNGGSFLGTAGDCTPCPARCFDATLDCSGADTGSTPSSMNDCCMAMGGMSFMSGGTCSACGADMGADPHFAVPLLNGQEMCYSLQGEAYFAFNLVSDSFININAYFIPPEDQQNQKDTATFLGDIGITIKSKDCAENCQPSDITRITITAADRSVTIGDSKSKIEHRSIIVEVENGMAVIKLGRVIESGEHPNLVVNIMEPKLSFKVQFVNEHLDLIMGEDSGISNTAHGIVGQFLRREVEVTEDKKFLVFGSGKKIRIEPQAAWEFLHTNSMCLHALPHEGIQAKGIIEGRYTDYIVDDLFAPNFNYTQFHL